MCYDPLRAYVLMVGTNPQTSQPEALSWDGTTWVHRGNAPWQGQGSLVWHAGTNQLLLVSGNSCNSWGGTLWQSMPSPPVSTFCAAYDPVRQETIAYQQNSNVVGVWNGSGWTARTMTSQPYFNPSTAPGGPHMAFDPVSNKIVLCGSHTVLMLIGSVWISMPTTRVYEWNGFGFNQRLPVNYPGAAGAMATDTIRQRVVMFDGEYTSAAPNHTWTLADGSMTRLNTPLEPSLRYNAAMAFDPVRGVCVLFGGSINTFNLGDTWEFDLGPLASFTPYGTGCAGSHGTPQLSAQAASTPRVGSVFQASVTNLPWSGAAFLIVGTSNTSYAGTPLPVDLGFLGAPGCSLLTNIVDLHVLTSLLGAATWSFPVPPVPGASFYAQVLPLDPGVNALGLTTSNGGHGVIGL